MNEMTVYSPAESIGLFLDLYFQLFRLKLPTLPALLLVF